MGRNPWTLAKIFPGRSSPLVPHPVVAKLFEGSFVDCLSGLVLGEVGLGSVNFRAEAGDFVDESGAYFLSSCCGVELGS